MTTSINRNIRAREALSDMIANGAVFHATESAVGPSFIYEVPGAGDHDRCRRILRDLRADEESFAAFRVVVLDLVEAP